MRDSLQDGPRCLELHTANAAVVSLDGLIRQQVLIGLDLGLRRVLADLARTPPGHAGPLCVLLDRALYVVGHIAMSFDPNEKAHGPPYTVRELSFVSKAPVASRLVGAYSILPGTARLTCIFNYTRRMYKDETPANRPLGVYI